MNRDIPTEIGYVVDAANTNGAAVMIFDVNNNNMLYANGKAKDIYGFSDNICDETYDKNFWRCVQRSLLDNPMVYKEPEKWLVNMREYRTRTKFGQYIIRHSTGNIYLARHQIFPGYGIFSSRLDITNEFKEGLTKFFRKGSEMDPLIKSAFEIYQPSKPEIAVGIVSSNGTIIDADHHFLDILEQNNGLFLQGKRIMTSINNENEFLYRAIYKYSTKSEPCPSLVLRISKREGGYIFMKVGMMFSNSFANYGKIHGICALSVIDPMRKITLPFPVLQQAFDFTTAEARVAVQLASGATPEEVAQKGGVSIGTIRNQMKSIFKKASVNKRSDLVRVLVNLSKLVVYP